MKMKISDFFAQLGLPVTSNARMFIYVGAVAFLMAVAVSSMVLLSGKTDALTTTGQTLGNESNIPSNDIALLDAQPSANAMDGVKPPTPSVTIPESYSQYTIVVEKTRDMLYVVEEADDSYNIIQRFPAALGQYRGDKEVMGDKKTPEGLYRIVSIKGGGDLPDVYGPLALVLNYPNEMDRKEGKTGDGIWIHGSGLGQYTERTEGCVELNDYNIARLEQFIDIGTPVYIFPEGFDLPVRGDSLQKAALSPDTLYSIKGNRDHPARSQSDR